jgi:hypothetical protein
MEAPLAAEAAAAEPPADASTQPSQLKKARRGYQAMVAPVKVWTAEEAVVEMGKRFDAWIAEPDSWIDPAPGRREQYVQDGSLFCLTCASTVTVTIENEQCKADHQSSGAGLRK